MNFNRRVLLSSTSLLFSIALSHGFVPPAVWADDERAALYEQSDRAEAIVVRLTAPSTEGAGILFGFNERYAYGITAKHVVRQQGKAVDDLRANLRAWPNKTFPVKATNFHFEHDLAVFQVDLSSLGLSRGELERAIPLDQLGSSKELDPADPLGCIGHSTVGAWLVPKQPVRYARNDTPESFLFEFDCPQGHSGGGVFDGKWRLVGMMINEERPYCRALRIESIFKIVQGWKIGIDLRPPVEQKTDAALEKPITVAVVDFDNRSGRTDLPDLGKVAQDITSSSLYTVPGITLVTRDRLASIEREHKLPGTVRANAKGNEQSFGRLLNADALVSGSILRYEVERRKFEGFDTTALQDISRMAISLQVLDVQSGMVRFSKTFDIDRTKQYPKVSSAPSRPVDRTSELLEALLAQAQDELKSALQQIGAGLSRAGQFIRVPVSSSPPGANVSVDGTFVGISPLTLQVTLGEHEIVIALPGHQTWRQRVKVTPGLTLPVRLPANGN